jgi:hypothetical protein
MESFEELSINSFVFFSFQVSFNFMFLSLYACDKDFNILSALNPFRNFQISLYL